MKPLAPSDELPLVPLLRGAMQKTGKPCQGDGQFATIINGHQERIGGEDNIDRHGSLSSVKVPMPCLQESVTVLLDANTTGPGRNLTNFPPAKWRSSGRHASGLRRDSTRTISERRQRRDLPRAGVALLVRFHDRGSARPDTRGSRRDMTGWEGGVWGSASYS